jgi:FkbM family methyltransferase
MARGLTHTLVAEPVERLRVRRDWVRFGRALQVKPRADLVLVGTTAEAYVVPETLPQPGWICYCAGVGETIGFELELAERFGCEVHAFDPTPRSIEFATPVAQEHPRLHFHPVGLWSEDTEQVFWAPQDQSHVSYSIPNIQHTETHFTAVCRRPSSIMRELGHDHIDLLKLNIEGAEYGVLDSLSEDELFPRLILVHMHVLGSVRDTISAARALEARGYVAIHEHRMSVTWLSPDEL